MCETTVIREGDALRSVAERFIRNVYAIEYGAQLQNFPSRLFALTNERGEIMCAAGVRLQEDGFFSELYLDSPIEQALRTACLKAWPPWSATGMSLRPVAIRSPMWSTGAGAIAAAPVRS